MNESRRQGRCRFCGTLGEFVGAHIIPQAFSRLLAKGGHALLIPHDTDEYVSKSRRGIYDQRMLCKGCEARFSPYDTYGKKFFLDRDWSKVEAIGQGNLGALVVRDFDYVRLKLFLLSVLWRAHCTSQSFFKRVDLGRHADRLRQAIAAKEPGDDTFFACIVGKFHAVEDDGVDPKFIWMNPYRKCIGRVEWTHFYLQDVRVTVKTGPGPIAENLRPFVISRDQPLRVKLREFRGSPEHRAALETVRHRDNDERQRRN